jgi:hypothetical protein
MDMDDNRQDKSATEISFEKFLMHNNPTAGQQDLPQKEYG